MVESYQIGRLYSQLIELIKVESESNPGIVDFLNYLKAKEFDFVAMPIITPKSVLKEFIRGANRYSDEFSFSEVNNSSIKHIMNQLFELLISEV